MHTRVDSDVSPAHLAYDAAALAVHPPYLEAPLKAQPLFDRILVEMIAAKPLSKTILTPETAETTSLLARVVAVGPGVHDNAGKLIPPTVKPGDTIYVGKYSGTPVEIEGRKLMVIREGDALLVESGT